jgi:hypothetical protein
MSWLSNAFGSSKNPAGAGMKYLDQIPGAMSPYFQPYISQGQESGGLLNEQYKQLTTNPGDFFAKLGQGYKESPGYQFRLRQALNAGENASAAGGMLGTPQDQQQQMGLANDIASQDYNEYMKNILGMFGLGQQGQQEQQRQGFGASTQFGENLASNLGSKAQLAYNGQQAQNQARGQNWANLINAGSSALGAFGSGGMNLLPSRSFG